VYYEYFKFLSFSADVWFNYVVKTQVVHRPAWPFMVTRLLQVDWDELGHSVVHINPYPAKVENMVSS